MHNTWRGSDGRFLPGTHWRKHQAFRDKEWLQFNYCEQQRSTGDIAKEFGVTDASILFWLKKHDIPRRTTSAARAIKHWGCKGPDNPMWGKRGAEVPNWKGGVTPERQTYYSSYEWKRVSQTVWERDKATCQRCQLHQSESASKKAFHIHHIVPFATVALRANIDNLVLLCNKCHSFVHSRRNTDGEFLPKAGDTQDTTTVL